MTKKLTHISIAYLPSVRIACVGVVLLSTITGKPMRVLADEVDKKEPPTTQPSESEEKAKPSTVTSQKKIHDLFRFAPRPVMPVVKPDPTLDVKIEEPREESKQAKEKTPTAAEAPTKDGAKNKPAKNAVKEKPSTLSHSKVNIRNLLGRRTQSLPDSPKVDELPPETPDTPESQAPLDSSEGRKPQGYVGVSLPDISASDLASLDLNDEVDPDKSSEDQTKEKRPVTSQLNVGLLSQQNSQWRQRNTQASQTLSARPKPNVMDAQTATPTFEVGAGELLQRRPATKLPVSPNVKPDASELAVTPMGLPLQESLGAKAWKSAGVGSASGPGATSGGGVVKNMPIMPMPNLATESTRPRRLPGRGLKPVAKSVQLSDLDSERAVEADHQIPDVLAKRVAELMGLVSHDPDVALTFAASLYDRWRSPAESEYIFDNVLSVGENLGRGRGLEVTLTVIRRFMQLVQTEELQNRVQMRIGRLYYENGYFAKAIVELPVDPTLKEPDRYQSLAGLVKAVSLIRLRETRQAMVLLEWVAQKSVDSEQRARASMLLGRLELLYQRKDEARQWLELAMALTTQADQASEIKKILASIK